ncbi:MAG: amidohydrolase family protein [Alphaproteobacteria bacterium]
MPASDRHCIDVHHHIVPPFYLEEYRDRIAAGRGGTLSSAWTGWSPELSIAAMDAVGVSTSVLSLSTPGVWFDDAPRARETARRVNEYAAGLVAKHPGRYGFFAAVPLPDPAGSLAEIAHALDTLGASGIGLLTSYGDMWLGDARFEPVMAELNRRKAVTFVHPSVPFCCRNIFPEVIPMIAEVPADTTRTVTNMLFKGVFRRYRDIRWIFCHAGGFVPMVASRIAYYGREAMKIQAPQGVEAELARLYYDLGGMVSKPAIAALLATAPVSQVLMGSDFPYVPLSDTTDGLAALEGAGLGLTPSDMVAIRRGNAHRLMPGLGAP